MPCIHKLNLIPLLGGPGAPFHAWPDCATQAASKVSLPGSGFLPFPWIALARPAMRFIRFSSLQVWLGNTSGRWHFLRRSRDRADQTVAQSRGFCSVHCFFLYGDHPRRSMRYNGKNLRPQLLDNTSSRSRELGDLNSDLDPPAY